jgi:hypothetical protein
VCSSHESCAQLVNRSLTAVFPEALGGKNVITTEVSICTATAVGKWQNHGKLGENRDLLCDSQHRLHQL